MTFFSCRKKTEKNVPSFPSPPSFLSFLFFVSWQKKKILVEVKKVTEISPEF
jgi:hypothetical protein